MKTIISAVALLSLCTAAQATNIEKFTGPKGEACTRVTDDNSNVVVQCGKGNSATIGPAPSRPSPGPTSGPPPGANFGAAAAPNAPTVRSPGAQGVPPEWGQQGGQTASPTFAPAINIVGRWSYQTIEENLPEDVLIIFQPNGQYNQFTRFPQTPVLGKQIVQVWGQYGLQGNSLTVTPAGSQVEYGPDPKQLCNVTTHKCITPDTSHGQTLDLQVIDENTIQTPLGIAKRIS